MKLRSRYDAMKKKTDELDDEMRPEYDFSKLKLVGRGIYAKRYRSEPISFYLTLI